MFRNSYEGLDSIWFFVDIAEGFIVIFMGFVLVLGEFFHPSVPLLFDVVERPVDVSFYLSLLAGKVFLLPFSFVLVDSSVGRGGGGGGCEWGRGFSGFEPSLIWDSDREWWWGWGFLFDGCLWSAVRS